MKNSDNDKSGGGDSNIQVFLRVRPSKNPSGWFQIDDIERNKIIFSLPDNFKADFINNSKLKHAFQFNGLIDMPATQDEVFKKVGVNAVQNAIEGFNSTIFAYGQTGSGKVKSLRVVCCSPYCSLSLDLYLDWWTRIIYCTWYYSTSYFYVVY
jgi:protein tyrosine phosphatase (PTP) superfamily phosphohydrolase (DUF442 family)